MGALTVWGFAAVGPAFAAWQVLVHEQVAPKTKDAPAKWSTTWSDGTNTRKFDGVIASMGGKLWALQVVTAKDRGACKQGKYPFAYEVDQLVAQPSGGGESKVLFGDTALASAKAVMKDHLDACDGIKPLPGAPDTTESYERTKLNILSVYNNALGMEQVTESFAYGKPNPMALDDWASYRLDKDCADKVSKKFLPPDATAKANEKFAALAAAERDPFSPADMSHWVLVPSGGGMSVEFGVPSTTNPPKSIVRVVRVDGDSGAKDDYSTMRAAFVTAHPSLVEWSKVGFYTISPDQSVVVFTNGPDLYWQPVSGKPKVIGQVKNVRGWQWHGS